MTERQTQMNPAQTPPDSARQRLVATPGQTVGPFFGFALPYDGGEELVPARSAGSIRLHGTVFDGSGEPVPDALIEVWQADADGSVPGSEGSLKRNGYDFTGFGRAATDGSGRYSFSTVLPGHEDARAPFISMCIFARGLMNRLFTRVYLRNGDWEAEADPFLAQLPADRRNTLIADADGQDSFRFDIRLQGDSETVFLQFPRNDA